MTLPMRKEVICREYGGDYSFCGALKGGKPSSQITLRIKCNTYENALKIKYIENVKFLF